MINDRRVPAHHVLHAPGRSGATPKTSQRKYKPIPLVLQKRILIKTHLRDWLLKRILMERLGRTTASASKMAI